MISETEVELDGKSEIDSDIETMQESDSETVIIDNEVEMPSESFEELFQIAKECDEMSESETIDASSHDMTEEKNPENVESKETVREEKPEIRGNYSKASADKIWKDNK